VDFRAADAFDAAVDFRTAAGFPAAFSAAGASGGAARVDGSDGRVPRLSLRR
jgi:hypothetical protein